MTGPNLAATKLPALGPGGFRFATKAIEPIGDADDPRFRTIASSTIKDRGNDEMKITALEDMRDAFRAGTTFYTDHKYDLPDKLFGVSDAAEIVDSGTRDKVGNTIWDLHVEGYVAKSNPRAMQLYQAMLPRSKGGDGVKIGTSVGAIIKQHKRNKEGGLDIDHVELVEGSMVGIPMNQRSWVQKAVEAARELDEADDDDDDTVIEAEVESAVPEITAEVDGETVVLAAAPDPEVASPEVATKADEPAEEDDEEDKDKDGDDPAAGYDPDHDHKSADAAQTTTKEATVTTDGQEADPAATPETASEPDPADATDPAPVQKALVYESDDVVSLVRNVATLVKGIEQRDETIVTLRKSLDDVSVDRNRLAEENAEAKAALAKIAVLPLRRKAIGYVEQVSRKFPDFIDPEVVKYLNHTAGE